jgi:hypothetical protein
MGQDSSRPTPIRGNYRFSDENTEEVLDIGYDEHLGMIDFQSQLFQTDIDAASQPNNLPDESLIIELCLNPSTFAAQSSVSEVWH